jgi:hypothetical protein
MYLEMVPLFKKSGYMYTPLDIEVADFANLLDSIRFVTCWRKKTSMAPMLAENAASRIIP